MNNSEKIVEVNSLSEYIDCIHKNNLENYISRGENKKFNNITASAFRYDLPIKFQNMISAFYDTVGNNITNMQRENFVAFSQHHGIPTNLIDFSTSPLVSLFFSCYGENLNDSGYVYFINNNKLININEIMPHTNYQNNLFKDLLQFNSSTQPLITKLYTYEHTHMKEMEHLVVNWSNKLNLNRSVKNKYRKVLQLVDNFAEATYEYPFSDYSKRILQEIIQANIDDRAVTTNYILWEDCIENYYKAISSISDDFNYTYIDDILLILILIKVVFGEMYSFKTTLLNNFELPFYFSYSPPNILPRVINQSSLFIYQLYHDDSLADVYIDKFENRITQLISSDFTIKINNKENILKSLDTMGINLKFIYNDFDSIAKYIKNSFFQI